MKTFLKIAALSLALIGGAASATVLNTRLHVDNNFTAYISTSDTELGTAFSSGNVWEQAYLGSFTLAKGQDYYLHIVANDEGGVAGFMGQLSLSDSTHTFANGLQTLLTNTTDWQGNNTGFDGKYVTLGDYGVNGVTPWYFREGTAAANWIWAGHAEWNDTAYFSTKISAVNAAEVPEPGSLALLGLGLAGLAALGRRRQG